MKLHAAVLDHDDREHRFQAGIHGIDMQDRHGQRRGRREDAMARMKARRSRR